MSDRPTLARRVAAEAVGTAFLLMAVVGSGIAARRLSPDDVGLQLLESSLVTGAALFALALAQQPVSASFRVRRRPILDEIRRRAERLVADLDAHVTQARLSSGRGTPPS